MTGRSNLSSVLSYMLEAVVEVLKGVPPELATVVLATVPVGELRGALPVALVVYKLPVVLAVVLAIAGNMLPVFFLLKYIGPVTRWVSGRSEMVDRFLHWLFERTRRKLDERVERYNYWALALFVAIPLPVTGAWTGALAAFVFGLPRQKSFVAILVGVCVSAAVVTVLTLGSVAAVLNLLA